MEEYFKTLEADALKAYTIAREARKKGIDPDFEPEIPLAADLAERVESLVGPPGIAETIRDFVRRLGREEAALRIARDIVERSALSEEEAAEQALRTSLAILTEGVVAAPMEGIVKVAVKENMGRERYLAVYFAGPIRSAGGSAQALAVLTADYIRQTLGLSAYRPTPDEIERFVEETDLYNSEAARLQYLPSPAEIRMALSNIPVEVTGEGTEKTEVSGHRDMPRIETNQLRGGAVLVIAEGVLQKAPKIEKFVKKLGLEGWEWLSELKGREKKGDEDLPKKTPEYTYIKDIIAGRPLLSHPSAKGGLRLRYGRSRCSGLAGVSLHPATMAIFDDFIATGTQIKTEKPGKGAVVSPCDSIEGPIVKLRDGSVIRLEDEETARHVKDDVAEVLFNGDILIGYGEFLENNHPLLPAGYCEEWWAQEAEKKGVKVDASRIPDVDEALSLCEKGVPLHPRYTYFFHDLEMDELKSLARWLCTGAIEGEALVLEKREEKGLLEILGVPHEMEGDRVLIKEYKALLRALGIADLDPRGFLAAWEAASNPMELVNSFGITVRMKAPTYIGARMGRPEKAKPRKMSPPVNLLFPIGQAGGRTRDLSKAVERSPVHVEVVKRQCPRCREVTVRLLCPRCSATTEFHGAYETRKIDLKRLYEDAVEKVGATEKTVKGVVGMTSAYKIPEPIEKGILRAKHDVYVFKDGTARFDATDMPMTHFKPAEIGVSVEKLRELGYTTDHLGQPLEREDQIVPLMPQDIILPEEGLDYLYRVSRFTDELLEKVYGLSPFYNAQSPEDLIGHLAIGLAPHTSTGMLARIIGVTDRRVGYAHPFFHAAKRRNCDGDEDSIILLMDALLNFSRSYLPSTRGGRMDAPLVLTTRLDPMEIDDEAHNIDVMDRYPLEFYERTLDRVMPGEVRDMVEVVKDRLDGGDPFSSGFTHHITHISMGPRVSSYLSLGEMREKVERQLELADKIRAVDKRDVARKVIESHFLPDLAGNLRTFSKQTIRCVACNAKYRRVPLSGSCRKCGGKLVLTVHRGSVEKYLSISKEMIEKYSLDRYLEQRITILERSIDTVFKEEPKPQISLSEFL
ncbi:MAG: DNA polymerase II large subunit [Methanobacteriota archaeon]|nr:MAG: DNA polymerase II large subunit [Euryarchaeota archaeon]